MTSTASMASAGRLGAAAGSTQRIKDGDDEDLKKKAGAHLKSDKPDPNNTTSKKDDSTDKVTISSSKKQEAIIDAGRLAKTLESLDDRKTAQNIGKTALGHLVI